MRIGAIVLGLMLLTNHTAAENPLCHAGSVVTLWARDPLASSFCLSDGVYGASFQNGEVRNRCSDLVFEVYKRGMFSVGAEGARHGAIVDLGTAEELQRRYGYEETVGGGQGFASIRRQDGKLVILKKRREATVQPLQEADRLQATTALASAPVLPGHVYVLRLVDQHDKQFDRVAKLIVLAHSPGESVTLRWECL